jgi:hypothetical protein
VLEEDPSIYDYDAAYDNVQRKRAKIEADVESKKNVEKKVRILLI